MGIARKSIFGSCPELSDQEVKDMEKENRLDERDQALQERKAVLQGKKNLSRKDEAELSDIESKSI